MPSRVIDELHGHEAALRFDEKNRLTFHDGRFHLPKVISGSVSIEYGAADQITAVTLMRDQQTASEIYDSLVHDEEGRLVHRSIGRNGEVSNEEDLNFVCE